MRAIAAGILAAAATVAAAAAAQADLLFSPPADWGMSLGGLRGKALVSWRSSPLPGSAFISVVEDRFGGTLQQYVAFNRSAMVHVHGAGFKPTETPATLCNGVPAIRFTFAMQGAGQESLVAEQLYTGANHTFYVVSYVRPSKEPANPEAQRALATACPK